MSVDSDPGNKMNADPDERHCFLERFLCYPAVEHC